MYVQVRCCIFIRISANTVRPDITPGKITKKQFGLNKVVNRQTVFSKKKIVVKKQKKIQNTRRVR